MLLFTLMFGLAGSNGGMTVGGALLGFVLGGVFCAFYEWAYGDMRDK